MDRDKGREMGRDRGRYEDRHEGVPGADLRKTIDSMWYAIRHIIFSFVSKSYL